ncbi:MAG: hypothetical protein GOMPHAMPRED_007965 [Gomphillus americanus]|uniref:Spindle pole body component n=1 Tax=Gomphillus americanus TaxID=1940652 RepID=A0A8H3EVU4_9LECA|nr:MAG: hypothetical protein GOMPHAMPRED_007965 [Gomphillus americanus]
MALPPSISNILSQLIDTFSIADGRGNIHLQRRLATILKDHYLTNSDVATQERFEGVEEKCRILNNDELADALLARYEKLTQWPISWKFDALSFLQHLSDNPVYKTRLEGLESSVPDPSPFELTWVDLLRDDPFDDPEIWKGVDYAASSSGESLGSFEDSQNDQGQQDLTSESASEAGISIFLQAQVDEKGLDNIAAARKVFLNTASTSSIQVTETQLMRDTLCMLHGIPSVIYEKKAGNVSQRSSDIICNVSAEMVHDCLEAFTKLGTTLHHIRSSTEQHVKDPLLQSFQACLLELLEAFDLRLSTIEREIIGPHTTAYTLMTLLVDVESAFLPLKLLVPLIPSISDNERSFTLLESLFDLVGERQSIGDVRSYGSIGLVFFQCLHTYLRPVTIWLDEGILDNRGIQFFIKHRNQNSSTSDLWHDQFVLDLDDQNRIQAPKFLWPLVQKMFAAGKGVNLLRALDHGKVSNGQADKATLTFASVCGNDPYELDSFEDLFQHALDKWVRSKCSTSETQVLAAVIQHGQLRKTLAAIEHLFLSKNGSLSQQFAYTLFNHMDRRNLYWRDSFWLTELCQDCFKHVPELDVAKVSVRYIKNSSHHPKQQSMRELSMIRMDYALPWPAAIVIRPQHIDVLQNIFVLLLRLRYASHLLDRHKNSELLSIDTNRQLILSLRQRFRWFVNLLLSHLDLNVINSAMKRLHEIPEMTQSLDELVAVYNDTMVRVEESCLVGRSLHVLLDAIVALLDLAEQFSDLCAIAHSNKFVSNPNRNDIDGDLSDDEQRQGFNLTSEKASVDTNATLEECFACFDKNLGLFVTNIRDTIKGSANTSLQILLDSIESGLNKR